MMSRFKARARRLKRLGEKKILVAKCRASRKKEQQEATVTERRQEQERVTERVKTVNATVNLNSEHSAGKEVRKPWVHALPDENWSVLKAAISTSGGARSAGRKTSLHFHRPSKGRQSRRGGHAHAVDSDGNDQVVHEAVGKDGQGAETTKEEAHVRVNSVAIVRDGRKVASVKTEAEIAEVAQKKESDQKIIVETIGRYEKNGGVVRKSNKLKKDGTVCEENHDVSLETSNQGHHRTIDTRRRHKGAGKLERKSSGDKVSKSTWNVGRMEEVSANTVDHDMSSKENEPIRTSKRKRSQESGEGLNANGRLDRGTTTKELNPGSPAGNMENYNAAGPRLKSRKKASEKPEIPDTSKNQRMTGKFPGSSKEAIAVEETHDKTRTSKNRNRGKVGECGTSLVHDSSIREISIETFEDEVAIVDVTKKEKKRKNKERKDVGDSPTPPEREFHLSSFENRENIGCEKAKTLERREKRMLDENLSQHRDDMGHKRRHPALKEEHTERKVKQRKRTQPAKDSDAKEVEGFQGSYVTRPHLTYPEIQSGESGEDPIAEEGCKASLRKRNDSRLKVKNRLNGNASTRTESSLPAMDGGDVSGLVELKALMAHQRLNSARNQKSHKGLENQNIRPSQTKVIAMDCEMVGVGHSSSALARVTLLNFYGVVLYDVYVRPTEPVTDFRTWVSGIVHSDLYSKKAVPFAKAQRTVEEILRGRILVGHALKNDLRVLRLSHPHRDIRDTSTVKLLRLGRRQNPKLQVLAREELGLEIQKGPHDSVEDARAALLIYKKHAKAWERSLAGLSNEPVES